MSLVIRQTIQLNSRGPPLGWFNSLAGIVKRRFASYVKSHLATTSGDGSKKNRDSSNFGHPMQPTSPYHFEKLCQAPTSSSMPSSPHFGNRAHIDQHYDKERMAAQGPRVFSNIDRRHRSPDPPPRWLAYAHSDLWWSCNAFIYSMDYRFSGTTKVNHLYYFDVIYLSMEIIKSLRHHCFLEGMYRGVMATIMFIKITNEKVQHRFWHRDSRTSLEFSSVGSPWLKPIVRTYDPPVKNAINFNFPSF